jgi:outer membrane biosynthesis protein TonB
MRKHRVLTEKAVNAKIVFRGVVVEIKKLSDQEVELTFPESLDAKELLSYLENFGVLKRKVVTPHPETQPKVQTEENVSTQQEEQAKEENIETSEEKAKKEDSTEANTTNEEEPPQEENTATTTKRRARRSTSN